MKKLVVLFIICFLSFVQSKSQSLGSYSGLDGGLENQPSSGNASSLTVPTSSSQSYFSAGTNATVSFQSTGGHSGPKYIQVATSNSAASFYSPTVNLAANTQYVVQYYYQFAGTNRGFNVAVSPNGGANFGTASTGVNVSGVNVWTKRTEVVTTANVTATGNGILKFASNGGGALSGFYFDDIVIYPGSTADIILPNAPTNVTATAAWGSAQISWSAANVDASHDLSGYLVVRTTSNNTAAVPVVNGIYTTGSFLDANTKIVYQGTSTSFVDNSVSNNTAYTYVVYSVDQAFNYNGASSINITPGTTSTSTSNTPGAFSTLVSTDNTTLASLTGNVAIGTSVDPNNKLKVAGNILSTGNISANGLVLGGTTFNPSNFHSKSIGSIGGSGIIDWNNANAYGSYDVTSPSGTFTNQPSDPNSGILLNFNNTSSAIQLYASSTTGALYYKTGLTDNTGKLTNNNWQTLLTGSANNQYLQLTGGALTGHLQVTENNRDYYVNTKIMNSANNVNNTNCASCTSDNSWTSTKYNYIILHRICTDNDITYSGGYIATALDEHYVMGKITGRRGSANNWNRKWNVDVNTSSAYNSTRGSIIGYNEESGNGNGDPSTQLVTLVNQGIAYLAVEIPTGSSLYDFSFTGYAYNQNLQIITDLEASNVQKFAPSCHLDEANPPSLTSYPENYLDNITMQGEVHSGGLEVSNIYPDNAAFSNLSSGTHLMQADAHIRLSTGVHSSDGSGNTKYEWSLYTAGENGSSGVTPHGFDIWEYPEQGSKHTFSNLGNGSRRRLQIIPSYGMNTRNQTPYNNENPNPLIIMPDGSLSLGFSDIYSAIAFDNNVFANNANKTNTLNVNGTIGTKKVKVTQANWPDYVFDSAYKLQPLESVETYIKANKHLPNVPAAAEMAKEGGLDLGDNQAVLMKKVEELTLYMIELKKQNESQQKQLDIQQKEIEKLKKGK